MAQDTKEKEEVVDKAEEDGKEGEREEEEMDKEEKESEEEDRKLVEILKGKQGAEVRLSSVNFNFADMSVGGHGGVTCER